MRCGKKVARGMLSLALLATLLLAVWKVFLAGRTSNETAKNPASSSLSHDPRLTYQGPYQNIDPRVKYVGSQACANCHFDIAASYAHHPMGRSFLPVKETAAQTPYAGHHNPFKAMDAIFSVEQKGDQVWHRRRHLSPAGKALVDIDLEVHFVIGSGNHGHSYITNRNGFLFQTPISWYSQKQIWDLSPGDYRRQGGIGRPVVAQCLFCHAHQSFPVEGSLNHYRQPAVLGPAIGCERCHGPGEKHLDNPGHFDPVTGIDPTIVNPAKLPVRLREAVCQQCHLEGAARVLPSGRRLYDFRPGLPLEFCWSIFVNAHGQGKEEKAINHVEQMYLSRCFQESSGPNQMGCISCHDPHKAVAEAEKTSFFRERCLRCHGGKIEAADGQRRHVPECSLDLPRRLARNDRCFECHMPRYAAADVSHAASTDHRILRRAGAPEAAGHSADTGASFPLVHFHRGPVAVDAPPGPLTRDLAFAQIELAHGKHRAYLGSALYFLEESLWNNPADWPAWEEKAKALALLGRKAEALQDLKTVLAQFPEREMALLEAATLARDLGLTEDAAAWWQKLADCNPWFTEPHANLTALFTSKKSWEQGLVHAEAWVRVDPANIKARRAYAECLMQTGRAEQARRERAIIEGLRPGTTEGPQKRADKLPSK
jgi:predicted CXXCH cytochrome family protein